MAPGSLFMIPRHWKALISRYAFLQESPSKLDEDQQAKDINRQLAEYGYSTENNPVALLWDSSASYKWWRFFQFDPSRDKLIRMEVPRECNPELFMRTHPNFRKPTLDDLFELNARPDSEAEADKLDREFKEKRAKRQADAEAALKERTCEEIEENIIGLQSGKFQERLNVPIPVAAESEPKPDKPLTNATKLGRPPKKRRTTTKKPRAKANA